MPVQRAALGASAVAVAAAAIAIISRNSNDVAFAVGMAAFSIFVPVAIGVLWWRRRPAWATGTVLVVLGGVTATYSLASADQPWAHALGTLSEPLTTAFVFALLIGFPEGSLRKRRQRALLALAAVALGVLYLPQAIGSPELRSLYPVYDCAPCPPNPLQVVAMPPTMLATLAGLGHLLLATAAVSITVDLLRRMSVAHGPPRRMLEAICWTSLLLLPALAMYMLARLLLPAADELATIASIGVIALWFVYPFGFALPFVGEDVAAAKTLSGLLGDLSEPRRRDRWRDRLAAALDDPRLEVAFRDEQSGKYLDRDGNVLDKWSAGGDRAWFEVEHHGQPLAALVMDRSLSDSPEVMAAAAVATAAAVEADRIETTLLAVSARATRAADVERSRMARTVQAGAQQRLAAMRVTVNMAAEDGANADDAALLAMVASELDIAIGDLRSIVWADDAATIARRGVGASLRTVMRAGLTRGRVLDRGLQRTDPQTELAIYYCCLEALQNATKHAGADVAVTIRLRDTPHGHIEFSVSDAGQGFDVQAHADGVGMRSMRERVEAMGGALTISSRVGQGTMVSGWVPRRIGPERAAT